MMGMLKRHKPELGNTSDIVSSPPQMVPPVFVKHEKQDLHMGHKPTPKSTSNNLSHIAAAIPSGKVAPYNTSTHSNKTDKKSRSPTKNNNNGINLSPVQNERCRPSTVLIEGPNKKKSPSRTTQALNGTCSTDLWIASTDTNKMNASQHSAASFHSAASYYEEEILEETDDDDEYDDDFFEYVEEEIVPEGGVPPAAGFDPNELPERKITIRFDDYDEMQTCLHINDYTKHEISKSWYKRDDYDKMVDLARKTASKAVEREKELQNELESVLADGSGKDDSDHSRNNEQHGDKKRKSSKSTSSSKKKKPIECRGLEAWTPGGSAKVRLLKESAIELVWNEQSKQWEEGTFDPHAIMSVYLAVSQTAADSARERGRNDEQVVKKLQEQEKLRKEKKRNRTVYKKSKALVKKTAKTTGKGLVSGAKGTGKLVTKTGKVGKELGKRGVKAGVATATLDPRMMKEALHVRINKRECENQKILTPSRAAQNEADRGDNIIGLGQHQQQKRFGSDGSEPNNTLKHVEDSELNNGDFSLGANDHSDSGYGYEQENDDKSIDTASHASSRRSHHSNASGRSNNNSSSPSKKSKKSSSSGTKKKSSKLKLLGVVPIPGTKKVYKEERREKRAEKRMQKMARRPSWEAGVSTGKY